jgi:type II secretion system protein N
MMNKRTILAYAVYLFAITVLFLYTAFPEESARQYVNQIGAKLHDRLRVTVAGVAPSVPPGLVLNDVRVNSGDVPILRMNQLRVTPRYLPLAAGKIAFRFVGDIHGGSAVGDVSGINTDSASNVSIRISEIDLSQLPFIEVVAPNRSLSGALDAEGNFTMKPGRAIAVDVAAEITNAAVGLLLPIGNIQSLVLDTLDITATAKGNAVDVTSCVWTGPMVAGKLSGKVDLKTPPGNSTIALNGNIRPQQQLINELGDAMMSRLFPGHRRRPNGFQIALSGSVAKPAFNIK